MTILLSLLLILFNHVFVTSYNKLGLILFYINLAFETNLIIDCWIC